MSLRKNFRKGHRTKPQRLSISNLRKSLGNKFIRSTKEQGCIETAMTANDHHSKCDSGEARRNDNDSENFFENDILFDHLKQYMATTLGGNRSSKDAKAILQHVHQMLSWTYDYDRSSRAESTVETAHNWLTILIQHKFLLIAKYCDTHLDQVRNLSPSTILHHLSSLSLVVKWFVTFGNNHDGSIKCTDSASIIAALSMIRKSYNKANKLHLRKTR